MSIRPEVIASLNHDLFQVEARIHALEQTIHNARQGMNGCWTTYYEMKAAGVDEDTLANAARINLELEAGITKSTDLLNELSNRHRRLLREIDAIVH